MNSYQFTINKKLSTVRVGENKFKFKIAKSGVTTINITQDKIEDVIYSVFDNSEYLDLVRIITNIKGTQQVPKIFLKGIDTGGGNGLVNSQDTGGGGGNGLVNSQDTGGGGGNGLDNSQGTGGGVGHGLVDAAGCEFFDTTELVLTDVPISVTKKRMGMELCLDDLVNTTLEVHISSGARNESLDIEDALLAYFTQVLRKNIQTYVFADSNDGILNKILRDGNTVNTSASSALGKLYALFEALPADWKNSTEANPIIFISPNLMTGVRSEIITSSAPITSSIEVVNNRFNLPLTNALVVATPYLTGTSAVAGIQNYLFLGTDLESDFEDTRIWYSNDNETIRFSAILYLGTAVADIESFVKYVQVAD